MEYQNMYTDFNDDIEDNNDDEDVEDNVDDGDTYDVCECVEIFGTESDRRRQIYVTDLKHSIKEEEVITHFKKFGDIISCDVKADPTADNYAPLAVLLFKEPGMVDNVQAARPHVMDGKSVKTKRAVPIIVRKNVATIQSLENQKRLYVGGTNELEEEDLRSYFGTFGKLCKVNLVVKQKTGIKKGFAFLVFENPEPVARILEHRIHNIKGTEVEVDQGSISVDERRKLYKHLQQPIDSNKLYVAGLKKTTINEEDLKAYFSKYAPVLKVEYPLKKSKKGNAGFAYIDFDDYDVVDKILLDKPHTIRGIVLQVEKASSSKKKKKKKRKGDCMPSYPGQGGKNNKGGVTQSDAYSWSRNDMPGASSAYMNTM